MTTVEMDLDEYGIYQITTDDPNLYAIRYYYVRETLFSNQEFKYGIFDLFFLINNRCIHVSESIESGRDEVILFCRALGYDQ